MKGIAMSKIGTNRASYQSIGNIRIGVKANRKPQIIATMSETQEINKLVGLLQVARNTSSHSTFLYNINEVERLTRKMLKNRH